MERIIAEYQFDEDYQDELSIDASSVHKISLIPTIIITQNNKTYDIQYSLKDNPIKKNIKFIAKCKDSKNFVFEIPDDTFSETFYDCIKKDEILDDMVYFENLKKNATSFICSEILKNKKEIGIDHTFKGTGFIKCKGDIVAVMNSFKIKNESIDCYNCVSSANVQNLENCEISFYPSDTDIVIEISDIQDLFSTSGDLKIVSVADFQTEKLKILDIPQKTEDFFIVDLDAFDPKTNEEIDEYIANAIKYISSNDHENEDIEMLEYYKDII